MKFMRRQKKMMPDGTAGTSDQRRLQPCDRAAEWEPLLYDYAEGLADDASRTEVRRHLAQCAYCRGALEDIRWMVSALQTSVPEPKTDISSRVMEAIRAEEEQNGRVITETVDVRTGRVLSDSSEERGVHRILRTLGGIAAAVVLVFGLMYVLPFLRTESGAASGTQDILYEFQTGADGSFIGGVFVGNPSETGSENGTGEWYGETSASEASRQIAVIRVKGADRERVMQLLQSLTDGGKPVTVFSSEDGFFVSPQSVMAEAMEMLQDAGLTADVLHEADIPEDPFFVWIQ